MADRVRPRVARADEGAALSALARAAKAHWGYAPDAMAAWTRDLTVAVADFDTQPTWVAERGSTLAGVVQLTLRVGEVELEHLWVDPAQMGQGVGRALLAHAQAEAQARGYVELHIDADPYAAAFYRACGARHTGDKPAPIEGAPDRVRPQFVLPLRAGADPSA